MSLKTPTLKYESIVRKEFNRLDSKGKIDLSKVSSGLHFDRIIKRYAERLERGLESRKEIFDPESIQICINSRSYNYTRPENVPPIEAMRFEALLPYGFIKVIPQIDLKTITREQRQELLDLPVDELKEIFLNYLQTNYPLPKLSKIQLHDLVCFFLDSFIEPIYCELLWDHSLVMSIVSIIGERRYE